MTTIMTTKTDPRKNPVRVPVRTIWDGCMGFIIQPVPSKRTDTTPNTTLVPIVVTEEEDDRIGGVKTALDAWLALPESNGISGHFLEDNRGKEPVWMMQGAVNTAYAGRDPEQTITVEQGMEIASARVQAFAYELAAIWGKDLNLSCDWGDRGRYKIPL